MLVYSLAIFLSFPALIVVVAIQPGQADVLKVSKIASGAHHNCAISLGQLRCWGAGGPWLGLGDLRNRGDQPDEMGTNLPAIDLGPDLEPDLLALGRRHTCVVMTDRKTVKCFGYGQQGALGVGKIGVGGSKRDMGRNLLSVSLGSPHLTGAIRQIVAGGYHNCVLFEAGQVKCWGANYHGQLGLGDRRRRGRSVSEMGDNLPFVDFGTDEYGEMHFVRHLAAGLSHTCALMANGTLKCWGYNKWGSLGLGDRVNRGSLPGQMGNGLGYPLFFDTSGLVVHVTCGKFHTCAVTSYHETFCWGHNARGQLGMFRRRHIGIKPGDVDEFVHAKAFGVPLPHLFQSNDEGVVELVAGYHHTCGIFWGGDVGCWGANKFGQLGIGSQSSRGVTENGDDMGVFIPFVKFPPGRTAIGLSCGEDHCCALLDNFAPYCWGRNHQGQLGLGDRDHRGEVPGELPPGREFSIDVMFGTPLGGKIRNVFKSAAAKWSSLITTDFTDLQVNGSGLPLAFFCGVDLEIPPWSVVDDLVIAVAVRSIDGPGGTIAVGGPCLFFPESDASHAPRHPRVGVITFDEKDLVTLFNQGMLYDVALHEIGHVLGIGTTWQLHFGDFKRDLIKNPFGRNPEYTGTMGKRGHRLIGGSGKPMIEGGGGWGTRLRHWSETEYDGELMTGLVERKGKSMPLSALSLSSLRDLGYSVREELADPFSIPKTGDNENIQLTQLPRNGNKDKLPNDVIDTKYRHEITLGGYLQRHLKQKVGGIAGEH